MVAGRVLLGIAGTVLVAGCSSAPSRTVSDGIVAMKVPRGWHTSVAFGHSGAKTAAYILSGNFRFRHARNSKALPSVPRGRALITIGDFPILGNEGRGWRRVHRLQLPGSTEKRFTLRRVLFHDRALYVSVHFGSRPTANMRQVANRRLASVHRIG